MTLILRFLGYKILVTLRPAFLWVPDPVSVDHVLSWYAPSASPLRPPPRALPGLPRVPPLPRRGRAPGRPGRGPGAGTLPPAAGLRPTAAAGPRPGQGGVRRQGLPGGAAGAVRGGARRGVQGPGRDARRGGLRGQVLPAGQAGPRPRLRLAPQAQAVVFQTGPIAGAAGGGGGDRHHHSLLTIRDGDGEVGGRGGGDWPVGCGLAFMQCCQPGLFFLKKWHFLRHGAFFIVNKKCYIS